jgi:hypothetical protein
MGLVLLKDVIKSLSEFVVHLILLSEEIVPNFLDPNLLSYRLLWLGLFL